jgi:GT2 family glycosyltransferase
MKVENIHGLIPPTTVHECIHKITKVYLNENDILILESTMKKYINQQLPSKTIVFDSLIKNQLQEGDIYNKCVKLINDNKKCIDEFYNNLSIIVLNYNNKGIIEKCIDSLLLFNKKYNYEIIVVDNQSSDGSYEIITKKYKNKVKVVQNYKNGCSSGRNMGVSLSDKKYIMFLDSDQWVLNDFWLDNYFEILKKKPSIGAIGWAAGWFNKEGFAEQITDNFPYRYMPPNGLYRYDIGYLGTGGMLLQRKLFNKIGGFDINYDPTCYEDTDISLKIRHAGKTIIYCPYLGIKHLPHQTTQSGTSSHEKMIKEKGNYFKNKWLKKNKKLLKKKDYIK